MDLAFISEIAKLTAPLNPAAVIADVSARAHPKYMDFHVDMKEIFRLHCSMEESSPSIPYRDISHRLRFPELV
jgi:hypothetical protein